MVEGCIVVIAVCIVLLNLIADLTYAVFDPRVRGN
jgi:ABC-type dipeptide/oligopeptide/nickel transport system permease component